MTTYHHELEQGSDEWLAARCGLLTASEMKLIITPTLKIASNDKERSHLYELLAQRITGYVEPHYISDDMLRGQADEVDAVALYAKHYAPVQPCGFVTRYFSEHAMTIGYSPDGLIGADGLIECKSRRQKFQIETLIANEMPADYMIQIQTGLLVSRRKWCDFVSYCGGLPMAVIRVYPDDAMHAAIMDAAIAFERRMSARSKEYGERLAAMGDRLIVTQRRIEQEMFV